MNTNTYVVIMAGGIGTRLWPYSRTSRPKQFHDFLNTGKSLLQLTAERFAPICSTDNLFVVTNTQYVPLVKEQLPFLSEHQLLGEPFGKNTAPCAAYACYKIKKANPNAIIIVAPSDHIILKEEAFLSKIKIAVEAARSTQSLFTLGIKPTRPDTGYGYIQFIENEHSEIKKVKTFAEKPHYDLAVKFLETGEFVWNAGIFIWNVNAFTEALQTYEPDMAKLFEEGQPDYFTDKETDFISKTYAQCKSISIDNAIMERSSNVYVLLADIGWSDLGTWKSIYETSPKDENNNVVSGNVITYDSRNCVIKTPVHKLVVVQGLENYMIIEHDNALLICNIDQEQKVKEITNHIKTKYNNQYN
ncbi:MAG: mannose-1-phosphate guanylyltransferase [Cytophagaceae bacterium]|nr:mannose-1-phosphate guanylyltransferase [Cytophagaceae bacterium]MDW8457069.1 mannose-1-phosphate guanylyltransferase [Cytophagaceae bacterium]